MRHFIFLLFFIFFISEGITQESTNTYQETKVKYDQMEDINPMSFEEKRIDELKNNSDFDYTEIMEEEANWWTQFKNWVSRVWHKFWAWVFGDIPTSGFWAVAFKFFPYVILIGVIAFVIWLFYKLNPGARILKTRDIPEVFFSEEEEIINAKDIKNLIHKAFVEQNYRLAIRYYYLLILKKLGDAKLIEYEFDKTNTDYISEIKTETIYKDFKKATTIYDYIWYGNFSLSEEDYKIAEITFNHLELQITNTID